jgi:hypothetical protein
MTPILPANVDAWVQSALADAERRGLAGLKPLLEALARATAALRRADFNDNAGGSESEPPASKRPRQS